MEHVSESIRLAILVLSSVWCVWTQVVGASLSGIVRDELGAPLPGVQICPAK